MKRHGILNPDLALLIAEMGHGDYLLIADAGLPIPTSVPRIDLALVEGVPTLDQTLEAILSDLAIEGALTAREVTEFSPDSDRSMRAAVEGAGATLDYITHKELKELSVRARAIVRTGECTPYNNLILIAGVHPEFTRKRALAEQGPA